MPIRNLASRSRLNACHVDRGVSVARLSRFGPRRRGRRPRAVPDVPSVARTRHPTVAMTIEIAASASGDARARLAHTRRARRVARLRNVDDSVPAGVPTASRFGATPVPAPLRLCAVPKLRPTICRAGPNSAAVEIPPAPNPDDVNHWKDALPANDPIDKQILKLFVPRHAQLPHHPTLVGAIDVFWVGRMGSAVALAAQGAANQVFQSAFWIISFVPSIIAPVVAKAAASGDTEEVQRAAGEAIFVASLVGLFGMLFLTVFQTKALGIVGVVAGSATATEAGPYIGWRALTFIPAIISTVGFAAFRGTLDVTTPMKITLASQMINLLLDPILIFGAGFIKAMGVAGAAMATSASEVTSAVLYVKTMLSRKIVTLSSMFRTPSWSAIGKLMVGGAAVQMRSVAQNITFLAVMRAILTMDSTGTAAAAHTVSAQMFQLGLISVLALSTLAAILIPQRINAANAGEGGRWEAKKVADRLLMWGLMLGTVLGMVQACALPALQLFTPLQNVQEMARAPVAHRRGADAPQRPGVRGGGAHAGTPGVRTTGGGECSSCPRG